MAHCRHSQSSPYVPGAGLDSKMVKPRTCFHSSSQSGGQERQSVAYAHNLYLQLCFKACLLPMSRNSHSTCLLAAFQSGAFALFLAEETTVTFMTCVVFNLFQKCFVPSESQKANAEVFWSFWSVKGLLWERIISEKWNVNERRWLSVKEKMKPL